MDQKGFPMAVAINYKIPLVMYGENGEVEYGGDLKNADVPTHNVTDDMTKHYFQEFILKILKNME